MTGAQLIRHTLRQAQQTGDVPFGTYLSIVKSPQLLSCEYKEAQECVRPEVCLCLGYDSVDMEREVFDVTWQPGCMNTFVAATGNAAIHLLDMRSVGQTTILYKPPSPSTSPASVGHRQSQGGQTSHPMARVAFDPANPHLLACLQLNDNIVSVLDVRRPGFFVAEMMGHGENVNGLAWRGLSSWDEPLAPRGASLATVSDDCTVLLWDPSQIDSQAEPDGNTKGKGRVWRGSPSAVSEVPDPVENVAWGVDNDYLAVTMGSRIRCMRI